jgi:hypothetical protein
MALTQTMTDGAARTLENRRHRVRRIRITIKTGSEEFEFELRGGDKAQRAYRFIKTELLQNEKA